MTASSSSRPDREPLQSSEERFRLLVESVTDYAIFMLDPSGHVLTWNAGAQLMKGYSADEIIGKHFSRFYPVESLQRIPDAAPAFPIESCPLLPRVEDRFGLRIQPVDATGRSSGCARRRGGN